MSQVLRVIDKISLFGNQSLFIIECLSYMYKILCQTNSNLCMLRTLNGKYLVHHLLCIKYSASSFTCVYSLTTKTSPKVRDFSLQVKTEAHREVTHRNENSWDSHLGLHDSVQSSCSSASSIPVQGHISSYVTIKIRVSQHFRQEICHYTFRLF